jgi:hypothetical protein
MKMEEKECSETLAFKLQTPVNHPEEGIGLQLTFARFVILNISLNFVKLGRLYMNGNTIGKCP